MICRKCRKEIPAESIYCNFCGIKQVIERSLRKGANGTGTVYKDKKRGTWTAEFTLGWDEQDGKLKRKVRKKRGFATKKEALEYMPILRQDLPVQNKNIKFKDFYAQWLGIHSQKVTTSTLNCYKAAYKYFSSLHYAEVINIRTDHMQRCIDTCKQGRRTKENMKALGTSLFRYAMQLDLVDKNYAEYIYIPKGEKNERRAFSSDQLELMWREIERVPDLKYILVLCYTGMRIGEMVSALTSNFNRSERYFIAGSKTAAGRDRCITISPRLWPFFADFGTGEYLFFDDGKKVSEKAFREKIYYPALQAVGLDELDSNGDHVYTPHCCRHTFATLMKTVDAPAVDKQKLIGHSKFEMTAQYTHTDLASLRRVTDNL